MVVLLILSQVLQLHLVMVVFFLVYSSEELGCESVKRLTVENFSAIVSQDCVGGNLYADGVAKYKK